MGGTSWRARSRESEDRVAIWYGASGLSRDAFRQRLLDPYTDDETVDRLRSAAKGIVDARTHAQLSDAGADLAVAAQAIGIDRWPRFLGDAERRGMVAVTSGEIPGVVRASATAPDIGPVLLTLGLVLLSLGLRDQDSHPSQPRSTSSKPIIVQQSPTEKDKQNNGNRVPATLAKPGEATLADDRRRHILDGDGTGGGGHGPSRGIPDKSEFPSDWSDDRTIEAVKDVANDPASMRKSSRNGRTVVEGTRDGVDISVVIGGDGQAIVTAYPTNVRRNGR